MLRSNPWGNTGPSHFLLTQREMMDKAYGIGLTVLLRNADSMAREPWNTMQQI
jgi:hypothetical protein